MKPRLLITGSSHVAAIRQAWDELRHSSEDIEVGFLTAPRRFFELFERSAKGEFGAVRGPEAIGISGRHLEIFNTINEQPTQNLGDYTHTVLVGCSLGHFPLSEMVGHVGIEGLRKAGPGRTLLSRAAYDAFEADLRKRFRPGDVVEKLAGPALAILPTPFQCEVDRKRGREFSAIIAPLKSYPDHFTEILENYDRSIAQIIEELGAVYFPQPRNTMTDFATTLPEYNAGSIRLDDSKLFDDPVHMNKDYGVLCLSQVLDWVRSTS